MRVGVVGLGQSLGVLEDGARGVEADVWVVAFPEAFVEEVSGVEGEGADFGFGDGEGEGSAVVVLGFEYGVFDPAVEGGAVDAGSFRGDGDCAFGQEAVEEFYLLEGEGCCGVVLARVRAGGRARVSVAFRCMLSYCVAFCRRREGRRRSGSVVVRRAGGGDGWGWVCFAHGFVHGGFSLGCGFDGLVLGSG